MFRKVVNDRLDQLQKQIQTDTETKKSADKQIVKKVLETCTGNSSDIKQLQSRLQEYKTSQQNGQLYITMKEAESKLKPGEIKVADSRLEKTNMQYTFEQNQDLTNMLSDQNGFGKLTPYSPLVTTFMKPTVKLTHNRNINMKTNSDKGKCWITGCVVLSSNKLVVADFDNKKLKVVDIKNENVIEEKTLSSKPYDIELIHQDQIAVTMPEKKEILIMTTAGKLSTVRKFPVKGECISIAHHQGYLYTVCRVPNCVFITDTPGNLQNTITLDVMRFISPIYLLLSNDLRHIFSSDSGSLSVFCITFQGDISAQYKNKDFKRPRGMMMLDDGSFLVCCGGSNGSIDRISDDLKEGQTIIGSHSYPRYLCYNRDQHEVYVGCYTDKMIVLSAK